jgi:ribosomal protein S12 methylthiotransferase accessory factor
MKSLQDLLKQPLPKVLQNGTHRTRPLAETWDFVRSIFPATGITRIADVTGLDTIGIPVCMAVRPNSKSLSVSQGKGVTLEHAKVSAAMEASELWHAEHVVLPQIEASYRELAQDHHVPSLAGYHLRVGVEVDEDRVLPWVEGWDLMQDRPALVPFDVVHCSFEPTVIQRAPFITNSNGLASGNHLAEAVSHALCEVIERDATHLWELLTRNPSYPFERIDWDTVADDLSLGVLAKLEAAGLEAHAWVLTSDVDVTVVGCAVYDVNPSLSLQKLGYFHGYGCHLNPQIALLRALTEAVQSRVTYISGSRDDLFRTDYHLAQSQLNQVAWQLLLGRAPASFDFSTLTDASTASIDGDLNAQLARLRAVGFDSVIALDLTHEDIGLPVAKVVIPGATLSRDGGLGMINQRAVEFVAHRALHHMASVPL